MAHDLKGFQSNMVRKAKHLILYKKVGEVAGHFMAQKRKQRTRPKMALGYHYQRQHLHQIVPTSLKVP